MHNVSDEEELSEDSRDQQLIDLLNVIASQSQAESYADDAVQEQDDDLIILPAHQRCASHTLNLVGCSSHPQAAKLNAKYRSLMHSSNAKLSAIWSKANSPKSNEVCYSVSAWLLAGNPSANAMKQLGLLRCLTKFVAA